MANELELSDYQALAEFRYQLRRFLRFSEQAARDAGIEPQQYTFLLAVKGLPQGSLPTVGELAERLQVQHHSAVELADRLEEQGLVQRKRGTEDKRQVLVSLTPRGERTLRELAIHHREQLQASAPALVSSLRRIISKPTVESPEKRRSGTSGASSSTRVRSKSR